MAYPIEFLEIGYPFRVFLDEPRPRYSDDVVKIEQVRSDRIPQVQAQNSMDPMSLAEPLSQRPAPATVDDAKPLWTIDQLATYLQVKVKSVYNLRTTRRGPAAVTVGGPPSLGSQRSRTVACRTDRGIPRPARLGRARFHSRLRPCAAAAAWPPATRPLRLDG